MYAAILKEEVRSALLTVFEPDELPRQAYYGDGSPIETVVLDEIREVYRRVAVTFPWMKGNVLMLDNMLVAHGRMPVVGPRQIVVGMTEPYSVR